VVVLSLDLPRALWPVTVAAVGLAAWGGFRLYLSRRLTARPTLFLFAASAAVFLGIPFYAVAFWADPRTATEATQRLPTHLLGFFMYGYLAAVALAIIFAKGYRWSIAAAAAFLVWMNSGIIFVASMAVSGVWL